MRNTEKNRQVTTYRDINKATIAEMYKATSFDDIVNCMELFVYRQFWGIFDCNPRWNTALANMFMRSNGLLYKEGNEKEDCIVTFIGYIKSTLVCNEMNSLKKQTGYYLSISGCIIPDRRQIKGKFYKSFICCANKNLSPEDYFLTTFQKTEMYEETHSTKSIEKQEEKQKVSSCICCFFYNLHI